MKFEHDWLNEGADPNDNDPDFWITDDGKCSSCEYPLDFETIGDIFIVEESGVQPGTPDGPTVHWATGYVICPNCGVELPYETSSA